MFVLTLFFCLTLFGPEAATAGTPDPAGLGNVTIFIYHKFGEDRYPTTNVGLDRFAEQMSYLRESNYQVISLAELVKLMKSGRKLPDKTAVITIDDGYLSTYTGAWPILKEHGFPFTVFLYVKAVDKQYRNFLTWEQVREMSKAGVDFQDHSYSHHRLGRWLEEMDEAEYRAWIRGDLEKSRSILIRQLGHSPTLLALPYGEYNTIIIDEAKKTGYEAVLSQDPGSVSRHTDIFRLPREPILGNDWVTMKHFSSVLKRVDLPFTDMEPGIGPLLNTTPAAFCASLINDQWYQPGTLGIYVSELGWKKAELTGRRLCIENSVELTRRTNRVAISGREKGSGRTAIAYWLMINPH